MLKITDRGRTEMECQEYLEEWIGDELRLDGEDSCNESMTDELSVIDDAMEL